MSLGELVCVVAGFAGFLNRKSDKSVGLTTMWLGLRLLVDYEVCSSYDDRQISIISIYYTTY